MPKIEITIYEEGGGSRTATTEGELHSFYIGLMAFVSDHEKKTLEYKKSQLLTTPRLRQVLFRHFYGKPTFSVYNVYDVINKEIFQERYIIDSEDKNKVTTYISRFIKEGWIEDIGLKEGVYRITSDKEKIPDALKILSLE